LRAPRLRGGIGRVGEDEAEPRGVAIALRMSADTLVELRVALTGTNPMPFVLDGTDALLGRAVDDAALASLGRLVQKQVSPMRTTVTASNHRRVVASVLAQRLLRELAGAAPPAQRQR
jgi:CO/xanthine dehydrogenase FAD-binding subunit